jgi:hypothetical protein
VEIPRCRSFDSSTRRLAQDDSIFVGTFDETLGQAEGGAEFFLAASHFAVVDLVVVAGQVEQTVKDKDLQFTGERVALIGSLAAGSVNADGQVAGDFFLVLDEILGGERKDVGGFVLAAELAIELLDGGVCGQHNVDFAAQTDCLLGFGQKTIQCWPGWDSLGPGDW